MSLVRVSLLGLSIALGLGCSGRIGSTPQADGAVRDGPSAADGVPTIDGAAPDEGAADGPASDGGSGDGAPTDGPTPTDGPSPTDGPAPTDGAPPTGEILLHDGHDLQFIYDDNGFHTLIQPGDTLPVGNWLAPVDYYHGEFRIRYVVDTTQRAGRLQTCIWTRGNEDGDGRDFFPESCSGQVDHDGPGTYHNQALVPADWWANEGVPLDFTHPERFQIRVVLRGADGCVVTRYASVVGACWDQWPDFDEMTFRVTIVMVPTGATFSGWGSYP